MGPTRRLREDELEARKKTVFEKDDTERRLENYLFGDEVGFLDALRDGAKWQDTALARQESQSDEDGVQEDDMDMQDVADQDLFFLDTGSGTLPRAVAQDLQESPGLHEEPERNSIWVDSDDERITVSLASNTRLRKLRDTEQDDIVSGTEYIRRLRRQYERLHPTPEWVRYARKKRKLTNGTGEDFESDSDVSINDQTTTSKVKPLAEILRTAGGLTRSETSTKGGKSRRRKLRPEVLDIQRTKDIASAGPSSIDTLQFHPYHPMLVSSGPSSTINIYHVSPHPPNPNPLLTSLHLKGTPVHTAAFCTSPGPEMSEASPEADEKADQTQIYLSSRRRYFHIWSLATAKISKITRPLYGPSQKTDSKTTERFIISPCGRYLALIGSSKHASSGTVNILSTATAQWICTCRIDSSEQGVADFAWWRDGNGLAVVGKSGEISEYSVVDRRSIARWRDEGAVGTTTIALGGDSGRADLLGGDRWVAVGSSSGVVNVYDRRDIASKSLARQQKQGQDSSAASRSSTLRPKPMRALDQLTTPTSHLKFSDDGQMLVMGSRWKADALRLVHMPSCTVYRNWPTDKTPLGRVSSVALSRDGGYLAVGNEQGKIRLWQIRD